MSLESSRRLPVWRYEQGQGAKVEDELAAEEPLEIRVEGSPLAVVMRTPGHDRELAAGFLLSEGVISSARDLFDITTCVPSGAGGRGSSVDAALAAPSAFDREKLSRHVITSSSCGVCSKSAIDEALRSRAALVDEMTVTPEFLLSLPGRLRERQETFQKTGGLHACALFDAAGALVAVREDVGRHNALDKLVGWALLEQRIPLTNHVVLLSGRASFEMVQKSHAAGLAVVAAISAPSSLAVEFAQAAGQTLVGFVRGASFNVYAGAERMRPVLHSAR